MDQMRSTFLEDNLKITAPNRNLYKSILKTVRYPLVIQGDPPSPPSPKGRDIAKGKGGYEQLGGRERGDFQ